MYATQMKINHFFIVINLNNVLKELIITIIFVKNAMQFINASKATTSSIAINVVFAILDNKTNISIAINVSYALKEKKKIHTIVRNVKNAVLENKKIPIIVIYAKPVNSKMYHFIVNNVNNAFKSIPKANI